MSDWSLLPRDILYLIVDRFETSSQLLRFRSVCSSWRAVVPYSSNSCCLEIKTHIPFKANSMFRGKLQPGEDEYCKLYKTPIFLLRFQTPFGDDYLLTQMHQTNFKKSIVMSLPLASKRILHERSPMEFNSLTTQIIPLGYIYQVELYKRNLYTNVEPEREKTTKKAEFLELDSEDCRDFAVLIDINPFDLTLFRSRGIGQTNTKIFNFDSRQDFVAFKGKFYVIGSSTSLGLTSTPWGHVFVIDPSSFQVTEIIPLKMSRHKPSEQYLVQSGEELLLVQKYIQGYNNYDDISFRVFGLYRGEIVRKWVEIYDLKDRVIFLVSSFNLCCSVQNLPGLKDNCIVFIKDKKYGLDDDEILVFDLKTKKSSSECRRGYRGAFGENLESLISCGLVTMPTTTKSWKYYLI